MNATISCPTLWKNPPNIETVIIENLNTFFRIIITVRLTNAPANAKEMLNRLPNNNPTMTIRTTLIMIALSASNKNNAKTTAILASPNFTPGIPRDGMNVSI